MKATVFVSLKSGVLDPQGKAIHHSLASLGYDDIADIRQGKFFEIALADGTDAERASAEIEKIARDILANPVIEDYRVEIEN
jgi:phosphoribosylformylglycinamidine synthase subunit PurS